MERDRGIGEVVQPNIANWNRPPVKNPAVTSRLPQAVDAPRLHIVPAMEDDFENVDDFEDFDDFDDEFGDFDDDFDGEETLVSITPTTKMDGSVSFSLPISAGIRRNNIPSLGISKVSNVDSSPSENKVSPQAEEGAQIFYLAQRGRKERDTELELEHSPVSVTIVDFVDKEDESERLFSVGWLKKEVEREGRKKIKKGETPWYHLSGTGFWVREQVTRFLKTISKAKKEDVHETVERALKDVEVDVEAFEDEYLAQMVNLRWNLKLETRDGKQRLVCPDYNNVTLESVTSKEERDGAVYKALFGEEGLEAKIATAPPNSFVIATSSEGWSGLKTASGEKIVYPESQIYVLKKLEDGSIQAYTLRYEASILQNEAFQRNLGLTVVEEKDQKRRIKNALMNIAVITPQDADQAEKGGRTPVRDFKDVVDLMQQAVDDREEAYGGKKFGDMKAFIDNPELFAQRHPLTKRLIQRFQEYARWRIYQDGTREEVERDLQIALAMTPLQLNKLYRDEKRRDNPQQVISEAESIQRLVGYSKMRGGIDYKSEKTFLEELPGCAGGGGKLGIFTMGGSRKGEIPNASSESYSFDHEGKCVSCGDDPTKLGPCNICIPCDAKMGGEGVKILAEQEAAKKTAEKTVLSLALDAA